MLKKHWKVFLILPLIFLIFATAAVARRGISYYPRIWVANPNLYPGDDVELSLRFEVGMKFAKQMKFPYTVTLFHVNEDILKKSRIEKKLLTKPVRSFKGHVEYKKSASYWKTELKKIKIDGLKPGYYMATLEFGKKKAMGHFHISRAGIIVKSVGENILLYAQDKKTSAPMPGMEVAVRDDKSFYPLGKTDDNGMFMFSRSLIPAKLPNNKDFAIIAYKDDEVALCSTSISKGRVVFKAYIFTDRPVYRPNQLVYFKGVLREEKDSILHPIAQEKVKIKITDPRGGKVFEKEIATDNFGGISGSIKLSEEPPLGTYYVYVTYKGHSQYGHFKVEEYRKPEYEITVKPDKKFKIQGEKVKFDVSAKYYFGAPVSNTEFTYTLYQYNFYPYYSRYWWEGTPYYSYGGKTVKTGKGKTDEKGRAVIEYKIPDLKRNVRYSLRVNMVDESRRQVTGAGSVIATMGQFYISMNTEKYFYYPSDKTKINISTKDFYGKPKSVKVNLKFEKLEWKKRKYLRTTIKEKTIETQSNGKGVYEFTPDHIGYFNVTATATDSLGNKITGVTSYYVAKDTGHYWYRPTSSITIKPDKSFYNYGDTVKLMIMSPEKDTTAIVTIEGDNIYEKRLLRFENPMKLMEFKAKPKYAPNVYVSVAFWKNNKFYHSTKKIIIPAKDKFLNVTVKSNKKKYRPREAASYTITTKKEDGTPVSCQVTMGIADESIYAVSPDNTPNIQKFFFGNRYNHVRTNSSYVSRYYNYFGIDTLSEVPASPPAASSAPKRKKASEPRNGGGDDEKDLVEPEFVREFFPDTCFFRPDIITNHEGKATVVAKLPDSLTTWRATARAASKKTEVGQTTHKVIVTKDLLVRLITPRFLVERDTTTISGIVHNYLDKPVEAHVELFVKGVKLESPQKSIVKIERNGKKRIEWTIRAEKSGQAKFTVKARTTVESDAMALKMPVIPHGVKEVSAAAGSSEDKLLLSLNLPGNTVRHSTKLKIVISPSLAGTLINALEYLAAYPYGCVEQTMSRFIPNAIVQSSLKEFGLKNKKLEKELPKMMKKGFDRIYDYHHSDGGWGWWKNDNSQPFMTAYVVYGLSLAKKAGYKVREDVLQSGIKWLQKNYDKTKELNTKAYMLFAMSDAGVHDKKKLRILFDMYPKLDNYSRAILAISLYNAGEKNSAETVLHSLEKTVSEKGTVAFWKGKGSRSWTDNPVETTAYVIKAFLLIKPNSPLVEKGVRYLTISRRGFGWYSTKDTAAAVLALIDYVKMTKEFNAEFNAVLTVNGKEIKSMNFTKADIAKSGVIVEIPGEKLREGENRILVQKKGVGRVYCSATLTSYTRADMIKAADNGIEVGRQYFLVTKKSKDVKKPAKKSKGPYRPSVRSDEKLIPLDMSKPIVLKPQDIVEVRITLQTDTNNEYVIIEDMKPAGCEAVKEKERGYWSWWYAQREYRDEKVVFFASYFWKGKKVLKYRLRAETPGKYRALPTTADLMYIPDVGGRSNEAIFRIEE
ncbi:MAG: hypothetical protein K8T10_05380 [Candidatus Eremiobacteraeota bacterium]|nr:hypothetical protein [Candidatus Eremiobacteraeota bacterium]